MAKKKNPKIPSPSQEDSGFPPNSNTNPPPPSSVIPLDDMNINKFFTALEKMGASIEKTNTLLSEKKSIESNTGAFSPEEKRQLADIAQKLQEEIALQNEVILEMKQIKNSLGVPDSGTVSTSAKEQMMGNVGGTMELYQVLKKENNVLSTLNTNIIELKTLQDEVREVVVKNYEKTISIADSASIAKKLKHDGGVKKSTDDVAVKTIQSEIKDDELLANDKKTMSTDMSNHRQVMEKLDRLYAANTAEIVLMKSMIDHQKLQARHEFENKIENENQFDSESGDHETYHKEQLSAHKESSEELIESNKEINKTLKNMHDHQKEQSESKSGGGLMGMIKNFLKTIIIFMGIGIAIGTVAAYITKYVQELRWVLSPLTDLIKRGFNSTETGAFILKGFTSIFEAIKSPIVARVNQVKNMLLGFAETSVFASKNMKLLNISTFSLAGIGRMLTGILGAMGAPLMGLLGGFFNLGHLITGVKIGFRTATTVLNKIFWPLQILISVIDGVIGAIKGFKLGGIKGAVMGAVAEIIDGLTFGLLDFEMMFHFFNEYMSEFFDGLTAAIQPTIDLFMEVWDIMVDLWNDFVSLFTGGGGWAEKIGKIFGSLTGALLRLVVSLGKWVAITLYKAVWEFPYKIGVWLNHTIVRLWNWARSGDWIEDLNKVGLYMAEVMFKLIDNFFMALMKPLAKLPPLVGGSIATMFGPAGVHYYTKAVVQKAGEEAKKEKEEQQKDKDKSNTNFADFTKNLAVFAKDLPNIFANMFNDNGKSPFDGMLGAFGDDLDGFLRENAKNLDESLSKAGSEGAAVSLKPRADYVPFDRIRGMAMAVSEKARAQASGVVAINSPTNISNGGSQQPIMLSPVTSRNNDPTYHGLRLASAVAY